MQKSHVMESGKNNKKVIFLLTGWYNKLWMYWVFSKIFTINGYYCITFAYEGDVFSPEIRKTNDSLKKIRDEILTRIKHLKKEGYKEFSIFGTSLGSIIALMVANKCPEISKIILNTTGIDVSEAVWGWDYINPTFKKNLLKQKLTLQRLKEKWQEITPANNIDNLSNKNFLIYLSEKDEVIPFSLGKRLTEAFDKRHYKYTLITNKELKHFYTGTYNLFNSRLFLNFLKS